VSEPILNNEEPEECDGCRFPGLILETYQANPFSGRKQPKRLCELCAESFIGNSVEYPEQYGDRDLMQLIGFCTNKILQKLEEIKEKP
jgi:hypothetical protein